MSIALVIFLILASLSLHELGHALAMRAKGIEIKEIALIGFRIAGLPCLKFTSRRLFPGTIISFHPFVLGAFVETTDAGGRKLKELSYADRAFVYGAGPLANFLFYLVLAFVALIIGDGVPVRVLYFFVISGTEEYVVGGALLCVIAFFMFVGRNIVCAYLFPVLGILLLVQIGTDIITSTNVQDVVGGPIMIGEVVGRFVSDSRSAIIMGAVISLSLGLINLLPLLPLDGGRIAELLVCKIHPRFEQYFRDFSFLAFGSLLILALGGDLLRLLN